MIKEKKTKYGEDRSPEAEEISKAAETEIQHEEEIKPISGFNMDEYTSKPIEAGIVIKRELTTIPAKKPNRTQFFRIHPDLVITVDVFDCKEDGYLYLVKQDALPFLLGLTKRVILHVGVTQNGTPFLLPVTQPDENGIWNSWHQSTSRVAIAAKKDWVRMQSNRNISGYEIHKAEGIRLEPQWPDMTLEEYLSKAFADRMIDDENHPIVKNIRGLI